MLWVYVNSYQNDRVFPFLSEKLPKYMSWKSTWERTKITACMSDDAHGRPSGLLGLKTGSGLETGQGIMTFY